MKKRKGEDTQSSPFLFSLQTALPFVLFYQIEGICCNHEFLIGWDYAYCDF